MKTVVVRASSNYYCSDFEFELQAWAVVLCLFEFEDGSVMVYMADFKRKNVDFFELIT